MSRKLLFLLVASVVMLYFSIILFMLHPLHVKGAYSYMNNFAFRLTPNLKWCKGLNYRTPPSSDVVALVSHPGSGNTWLRYLLQQVTGILTGSIYMDHGLRLHGFPAENVTDGSVLVVKTHDLPPLDPDKFKAAVLLIRNPRDAILADFNRIHKGHIGTAPKSAYKLNAHKNYKSDWPMYVLGQLAMWESLHRLWLTKFTGPVHIVFYERLVRDTKNTLTDLLGFLNHNATEDDMFCTLINREGIYRRKSKHRDFDPFTEEMYKAIDGVRKRVFGIIRDYMRRRNDTRTIPDYD